MPLPLPSVSARSIRRIRPTDYPGSWEAPTDPFVRISEWYHDWLSDIAQVEKLFQEHIYSHPNPSQDDFRQHRSWLYSLIAVGEEMALQLVQTPQLKALPQCAHWVAEIDAKVVQLAAVLFEWHAPITNDSVLPDSLRQSLSEAKAGNLVPFEL